jgi:hypothetical protein
MIFLCVIGCEKGVDGVFCLYDDEIVEVRLSFDERQLNAPIV